MVFLLRRREAKMTQPHLAEYASAGWLNSDEVTTLGTPAGRRQARKWARQHGLGKVMKEYIKDATHLAFTRNRIVTGRDRIGSQKDEQVLLYQVAESRRALAASHAEAGGGAGRAREGHRADASGLAPHIPARCRLTHRLIAQWRVIDSDSSGR